jgi:hypothetical protein
VSRMAIVKVFRKRFYHYKLYMSAATADIAEGIYLAIMFTQFAEVDPHTVVRSMMPYQEIRNEDGDTGAPSDFTDIEVTIT